MELSGWIKYNHDKWALVKDTLPGLSLSQTGPNEATFILGYSSEEFGEQRVIIGRPARVVAKTYSGPPGMAKAVGFQDEHVVDGGENVSIAELKAIVECWRQGLRYKPAGSKPIRR